MSKEKEISSPSSSQKWRIMKNVLVISVAFTLHFTAFSGAANLQSSINAEAGLGMASLAAVYAGFIFSNIFLAMVVNKYMGTKWAMCSSFLLYMPYIAAQLWARFSTLLPTGLIVGLGAGPLWCAKCTYIAVVAQAQSKTSKVSADVLLSRYLGIFFMIFQLNQVFGNLISSLVLTSGDNEAAVTAVNASLIPELCGAHFLPNVDADIALQPQPPEKIQMLVGIFLACMVGAAIIVAIGVDSMKRYDSERVGTGSEVSGVALLVGTLKLLLEPNQQLLVIINVFLGMQQGFLGADVAAAFVSCAVGTGMVGYFMMAYGIADAIACVITGYVAKVTGRPALMVGVTLVQLGLYATLLFWKPQAALMAVPFAVAIVWGICDSVWMVQLNAFYGVLFPGREEAAFSNFRLWESVGFIVAYLMSPYFRLRSKAYLHVIFMIVGVFCYFFVEYRVRRTKRKSIVKDDAACKGCDNIAFQTAQ